MKRYERKFEESTSLKDIFMDFGLDISKAKKVIEPSADTYLFNTSDLQHKKVHDLVKKIKKLKDVDFVQINPDNGKIKIN
jgi:hypothetical protein